MGKCLNKNKYFACLTVHSIVLHKLTNASRFWDSETIYMYIYTFLLVWITPLENRVGYCMKKNFNWDKTSNPINSI